MANNSDEIEVVFKATTNKKSAEKTGSELVNTVQDTVDKKGGIELDLKLAKKPIKGLEKEKKEILDMWKEVSEKGGLLSVPKKEVNTFLDKYSKFSKLVGQSHKNNTQAYKEMNRIIGEQIKLYKETFSEKNIKRAQAKWSQDSKTNREVKKQTRINEKENTKFIKNLAKGAGRSKASPYQR